MNIFESNRVLKNFSDISRYPRNSASEKAVSDYIKVWTEDFGLEVEQDDLYNLIIKKPASFGYESKDALILQAHMDMVCEKRPGSKHDFSKDPIQLVVDGDWLCAEDTSLGADNGIGVALAMSILETDDLQHPPLEVVFTVQEETTFDGAKLLDKSSLSATRMINLDHACDSEIIIGSCGGVGINFDMPIERASEIPQGLKPYRLTISGLTGGHSGEDIHRGRGSAIALMLRLVEKSGLPLVGIDGGSNRLAIPRECSAIVLTDDTDSLNALLNDVGSEFIREYPTEKGMTLTIKDADSDMNPLTEESLNNLRLVLRSYPNGIVRMFDDLEGIVAASDNIGIIETKAESIRLVSEARGAYASTVKDILESIRLLADFTGSSVETFSSYLPWKASDDSSLVSLAEKVYADLFAENAAVVALHAGLECSFFAEVSPGMDIISIGPNCQNFHSTEERVSISSTLKVYDFLVALLSEL